MSSVGAAVRILGPVDLVSGDGSIVGLGGTKQIGVLALLALEWPRAASVDRLIEGVWGENPPATARNVLQVYVSGLRKALRGEGADIVRTGDSYQLELRSASLDLDRFEQDSTQGRSALLAGDPV